MDNSLYDIIIIGSGPAGLTAGLYNARANLKTLIIAGRVWGGQLMLTTEVENFPGFPDGIQGPDLMMLMRKQTEKHGATLLDVNFKSADFSKRPFTITTDDDKVYQSKALIIATGANTKWLDVPGEKERIGRGISSCAPCDGAFYRNKKVIVVGGGDSAMEEALVLTRFATEVTLIHRRDSFKASKVMQDKVFNNPKIKVIWNTQITEIQGDNKVQRVMLKSDMKNQTSKIQIWEKNEEAGVEVTQLGGTIEERTTNNQELSWTLPIDGVFVAIGHIPNSELFKGITVDEKGFIQVTDHTKTNIEGVFVAGDVYDSSYMQAITAAGLGCMAALDAERWIEHNK